MSKFVLLILINLPLLLVGVISAITDYKASRSISKRKCVALVILWISIGIGLVFTEQIYNALIRSNLTDSPPMSLFDIALLTTIVFCLLLIVKLNEKFTLLNQKFSRLHERLAIVEAETEEKN